jgi:hypothetical protein
VGVGNINTPELYSFHNGLLWKVGKNNGELRLCIPDDNEFKTKISFSEHDDMVN